MFGCNDTEVAEAREPSQVVLSGHKCVAKREHVRTDDNLEIELCEEQSAPPDLVSETLVGKVLTKRIEHRGRVQVRVERGVEVERHKVPVWVHLPQIPHDASGSFNEAILSNDNRLALFLKPTRNRQTLFV